MKIISVLIASIVFVLRAFRSAVSRNSEPVAQQPGASPSATTAEAKSLYTQITKLYSENKYDEAIPLAKHLLKIMETELPRDHSQIASASSLLAQLYMFTRNYREAEPLLLRAIQINETAGKQTDPLFIADLERYTCVLTYFRKEDVLKKFDERRVSFLKQSDEPDRFWGNIRFITEAVTMPKPVYPAKARSDRASGDVRVNVHIDEQGQVTKAVSMCAGHPSLLAAAEEGAMKSKFKPILTSQSKPVRVIGYLSYRFVGN